MNHEIAERRAQRAECRVKIGGGMALLSIAILAGAVGLAAADEIIDRVLAVVAGELIMLSDVTGARDLGLIAPGAAPDPTREILSRLIDRALILAEVERYAPPEPSADAVDDELQHVRSRFPTSQAFGAALARAGIDETHLRGTLREDLRIRAYSDQRFTQVPPSDEDLVRYYSDHPQAFMRDGRVVPFDLARQEIVQAAGADRRRTLIEEWVAGLRRRADIIDLYVPGQK